MSSCKQKTEKKAFTPEELARILQEEFDRDSWGDIDPYLFKIVADGTAGKNEDGEQDEESLRDETGMKEVLARAARRITKHFARALLILVPWPALVFAACAVTV